MSAPSYSTNAPPGWCGDPTRGAAMGRPSIKEAPSTAEIRLYLRRVRLDSGGYDPNGTYFGLGEPLFWCADADGTVDVMLRAPHRTEARAKVLGMYPKARFFR